MTSIAVKYYAMGLCFVGLRELLSRYYYAYANTKIPMINAAIGVLINILMNLVLSRFLGIGGLAFATSLSALITTILLLKSCNNSLPGGKLKLDYLEIIKIIVLSIIMGVISFIVYSILPFTSIINLILAVLLAIIIYFILSIILKLKYINIIKDIIQK